MIQAGDSIGPYTLVRTLGRGAFGEVWLAERRSSLLTTQVALKLPLDAVADLDVVRQEARVWLRASGHPNIVPVMDAEVYDGQVVIASEYVSGGSLADWLSRHGGKAPSVQAAVDMLRGILAGLEYLHQNQLIHRDLKPDNVLLQSSIPRLTDFGLTRVLKPSGHTSNLAGTPGYMAPEAFKGQYSPASDVWAAGMLLHEMLTSSLPYPQTDFYSLLLAITSETPVVMSDQMPDAILSVLTRALAKPVADRFTSAAQMAEALHSGITPRAISAIVSAAKSNHNLPVQMTSFIGRETEMEQVKTLLSKSRLLTLTGSGGTGKTRLMLQAASDLTGDYTDGVWLVELGPLADADLVPQAVATALDIREEPGQSLTQTLVQALKSRNLLLVLDNCEHLLAAAAAFTDALLTQCPDLKIVASSREGLGVNGEQTYRVPSLGVPDTTGNTESLSARVARDYDSVRLFADRAALVKPDFSITDTNAASVARLCYRLDGIPLAIELAAARVRSLPVEQIEARLHDRFRLLTGGSRTAVPRQQTLRALIDWSYDLLDETEKALLPRLSVFAGGWSLEAAEMVCVGEGIEDWEMLDVLTALVDKSLVVYEEQRGDARFRLLETVRQYARDRLVENGKGGTYRSRHRDCFRALAEEAEEKLNGPDQGWWLTRLETEHDNLRQALTFCLEEAEGGESGLRLGAALAQFWLMRGHLSEGRERLTALMARAAAQEHTRARADALNGAGRLAWNQGDYASARSLLEESLAIRRELGDSRGIANSLNNLGIVTSLQGDYASARSLLEESLAIRRELGDRQGIAYSINNLGLMANNQGHYASARSLYEESLEIFKELGDRQGIASSIDNLGVVTYGQGDYASACSLHQKSLAIFKELGDRRGIANSLNNLGLVADNQGDYASARSLLEESLAIRRELGDREGIAECLELFARLLAMGEKQESAARLWGAGERLREDIGSPLTPLEKNQHDRKVAAAGLTLGEAAFSVAWAQGRALTMEEAIELALEDVA